VSTQCDRCLTNLPWKIDVRMQYLTTQWSTQAFSLSAVAHSVTAFSHSQNSPSVASVSVKSRIWSSATFSAVGLPLAMRVDR
jgi:hypothetical protein